MRAFRIAQPTSVRAWSWALSAAFPLVVGGCGTSDQELGPADHQAIPPGAAVASIQCIGAPTGIHGIRTTYPEQRVFLESQGWWGQRTGTTIPQLGSAEHIHVGMCFPLQKTVSGNITLVVRVMAHNLLPGSVVKETSLHDPGGGSIPDITWNHTIGVGETDWTGIDSVTVNTANIPDGWREFRNLTKVERGNPDPQLHASSGWCWDIENNAGADTASGTCVDSPQSTMGRGWYDCFEYKIAEADGFLTATGSYPYGGIPAATALKVYVGLRDGAGPNATLTSWGVHLNPRFHDPNFPNGYAGDWQLTGIGTKNGLVTVPAAQITAGQVETLALISHASSGATDSCTTGAGIVPQKGEVSAVMLFPFKVNP
jgi:hypothetical protein